MLKDATYVDKFKMLEGWMAEVCEPIRRDLRRDHLKADRIFHKKYFQLQVPNRIGVPALGEGYYKAIVDDGKEDLGEYVCNRWLLQNTDMYDFFAVKLAAISPDFDKIDTIDADKADPLIDEAVAKFGAVNSYIFSVLNSAVFAESSFKRLINLAEAERAG